MVSRRQVGSSGCTPSAEDRERDALGTCNRANRFAIEKIAEVNPDKVILAQSVDHQSTDFAALVARLRGIGVRQVILVGPVPQWQPSLYKLILKSYWGAVPQRLNHHLRQSVFTTDRITKERYEQSPELTSISLVDSLCDGNACLTHLDGHPKEGLITYDYGHFTLPASEYVVRNFIAPALDQQLAANRKTF